MEVRVLDAYIIEKIKREQEQEDSKRVPLKEELPRPRQRPQSPREGGWQDRNSPTPDRGVVIIDM
ncbi:MAG: hypothetical protein VX498_10705 [Myxococcota bacterium]|nr:hypothetical protein [Myxococcota bacterium]